MEGNFSIEAKTLEREIPVTYWYGVKKSNKETPEVATRQVRVPYSCEGKTTNLLSWFQSGFQIELIMHLSGCVPRRAAPL